MELWELTARELVRETVTRYAHLVDRGRIDELIGLFTEDGTLEAGDRPPVHGRDAIRAFFLDTKGRLAAAATRPLIRHHVSNTLVEIASPESATAVSYSLPVTERGPAHGGRYQDRLVQRGGRWLFQHRRASADGYAPGSVFASG